MNDVPVGLGNVSIELKDSSIDVTRPVATSSLLNEIHSVSQNSLKSVSKFDNGYYAIYRLCYHGETANYFRDIVNSRYKEYDCNRQPNFRPSLQQVAQEILPKNSSTINRLLFLAKSSCSQLGNNQKSIFEKHLSEEEQKFQSEQENIEAQFNEMFGGDGI